MIVGPTVVMMVLRTAAHEGVRRPDAVHLAGRDQLVERAINVSGAATPPLAGAGPGRPASRPGNEPSAAQVAGIIKPIKAAHVGTCFFENSDDPRLVRQIADATGAQPGGELYVEALSPADGPAPTYAEMFKYNVDKLMAGMKAERKS